MSAVQRRLQALLAEWPEHPLLVQLQEISNRILSLPACGPLKAALTGVELLLSRAQTWEEGAASHVSLSSQLQLCAALAMRWRAAEVNAWPHALAAVTRAAADAANATWFPLHRLMFSAMPPEQPDEAAVWLRSIATALEEFLRGASLGEFERRVTLLWAFYSHATLDAASAPAWAPLAALLCTLHRYYMQFVDDVNRVLDAARLPIEAKLKDHVKLAKWEVRCSRARVQAACSDVATHLRTAAAYMPPARPKGLHTTARQFWVGATTLCVCTQSCRHIPTRIGSRCSPQRRSHRTAVITRCARLASATNECCIACCITGRRFWRAPWLLCLSLPRTQLAARASWRPALPRWPCLPLVAARLLGLHWSLLLLQALRQRKRPQCKLQPGTHTRTRLLQALLQSRLCVLWRRQRRTSPVLRRSLHGSLPFWRAHCLLASPSDSPGLAAWRTFAWLSCLGPRPCVQTATRRGP